MGLSIDWSESLQLVMKAITSINKALHRYVGAKLGLQEEILVNWDRDKTFCERTSRKWKRMEVGAEIEKRTNSGSKDFRFSQELLDSLENLPNG